MWRQMLSGCLTGTKVNDEQAQLPCRSGSFKGEERTGSFGDMEAQLLQFV